MMGFMLLNFLAFCVVLLCVFTFLVPCCGVLYDVRSFTSSCLISSCVFLVYVHVVMSNICPIKSLYVLSSVMSATISTYKRCSVRLYLQLFVRDLMSDLRYLSLLAYSGVQYILCCNFFPSLFVLCFLYPMLPVSPDCPFLVAPSVFSIVYLL